MTAETPRTQIVAARLDALSMAVAEGRRDEFTMRIPAEPDRDADLVLAEAARMVLDLTAAREQIAELDGAVRMLGTVQTQLIAERDAARARVAELETFVRWVATYPKTRGEEINVVLIRDGARALLSPSPEPTK